MTGLMGQTPFTLLYCFEQSVGYGNHRLTSFYLLMSMLQRVKRHFPKSLSVHARQGLSDILKPARCFIQNRHIKFPGGNLSRRVKASSRAWVSTVLAKSVKCFRLVSTCWMVRWWAETDCARIF